MEFLDPKKHQAHLVRLFIGYALIGVALLLTTIILLYQAYGFGLKNGEVIQNGLIFVSSSPNPADIYVNGQKHNETTNSRLLMPAGQYAFELKRDGYRPWKRAVNLEGGTVARFDYAMLFPTKLTTASIKKYDTKPTLATESPDRRWLFVQGSGNYNVFDVFDFSKPDKPPVALTVPQNIFTLNGKHSWQLIEWSNDNNHVLLRHIAESDGKQNSEFILVDREDPAKSVNLSTTLGNRPSHIELRDKKYDQYFIYTQENHQLLTASLDKPQPALLVDKVLGFKTHGDNTVLYATDQDAPPGKSLIKLRDNKQSHTLRQVAADPTYMLELTKYDGDWYVVAGAPSENRTYVYKNPASTLNLQPQPPLAPVHVLKTPAPNYVSFSDNARFIMTENSQHFAVYDAENEKGYAYRVDAPLDAPQKQAEWMDGHRLSYISGGKTIVFDYDHTNQETLAPGDSIYPAFFDRDYEVLYSLAPASGKDASQPGQYTLGSTPLRTTQDQ